MRSKPIKLLVFRRDLQKALAEFGDENPDNTSLILISHSLNKSKTWILAHGDHVLTPDEINTLQIHTTQFLQGVPLPYVIGAWEFFGRRFTITPDVLIPRPETELLVELAIALGQRKDPFSIIDVGTGSGIIAISLASNLSQAEVIATDLSHAALKVAKENARHHHQDNISFIQCDLLSPFWAEFDLICANLPYIPSWTLNNLEVTRWEPRSALDGGPDGMTAIRRLLEQAKTCLKPEGSVLLEIEASLGQASLDLAKRTFPVADHHLHQDLSGKNRLLHIQRV